jgi:O-antigen/teichoic acid export membrane protein
MIGYKLRYKTDEIVIGTFLSVTAITYFSIGDRLLDYAGELVGSLAQLFVPMAGQSHAKGDTNQLRTIWIAGNRACALIIFPITAVLVILGKSVITAWVGAKYVAASYPVLVVLAIPMMFMLAQGASARILYGMAKHRTLAWVTLMESVTNLILSIVLIRPFGIVGDAFGTAIPLMCTSLVFMPRHMCRLLGVRIGTYLREAYTLPLLLTLPLAGTLLLMRNWYFAHNYFQVALQILIGFLPYGLGLLWATWTKRAWRVGKLSVAPPDEVAVAFVDTLQGEP